LNLGFRVESRFLMGDDFLQEAKGMAFQFENGLGAATEQKMRDFFVTLSEKDQRRFAAFEAQQLGHGGIGYVSDVLGISRRTIERGIEEFDNLPNDPAAGRIRRPGAGRPKKFLQAPK
jgi:hypothetical protein